MQETRQNKIARLLQKELSVIFQQQTRSMHGVMVSVTRVRVSPDLSICTAHLSIFPSERGEELMENIHKNEKQIWYELGTRVRHKTLRDWYLSHLENRNAGTGSCYAFHSSGILHMLLLECARS